MSKLSYHATPTVNMPFSMFVHVCCQLRERQTASTRCQRHLRNSITKSTAFAANQALEGQAATFFPFVASPHQQGWCARQPPVSTPRHTNMLVHVCHPSCHCAQVHWCLLEMAPLPSQSTKNQIDTPDQQDSQPRRGFLAEGPLHTYICLAPFPAAALEGAA
jgi:hypothetical protein